jgi:hypothetical protein
MNRRTKNQRPGGREATLQDLQKKAFKFFTHCVHPKTGLVLDSNLPHSPSSIGGVGFALSCYPVAIERGFIKRAEGLSFALAAIRFFDKADQSGAVDGVGYKGFFYHFLDPDTGRRAWKCELSTIDTTLLIYGMLLAAQYFSGDNTRERELRERTAAIYGRVDWRWAQHGQHSVVLGWKPERGFFKRRWFGYNEAMLLYVLALGSTEHPIEPAAYATWTSTFRWLRLYGHDLLYAGPMFIHQFPHIWLDLRGIQDAFMASKGTDYFENSRRAAYVQQQYAIRNPRKFIGYGECAWGFTASNGPADSTAVVGGRKRRFRGYLARAAPFGPDDGTIAPWAVIASLPFAPELVFPAIRHFDDLLGHRLTGFGFHASYNPTFRVAGAKTGWTSPSHYAINQGPLMLMIENYRTGLIWRLMRDCAPIRAGLLRAGFGGGWLGPGESRRGVGVRVRV